MLSYDMNPGVETHTGRRVKDCLHHTSTPDISLIHRQSLTQFRVESVPNECLVPLNTQRTSQ